MFRKENLWRHKKHCCLHNAKTSKTMIQAEAATLILNPLTTDDLNNHVLSRMRLDDIGQTVRSDKLILLFGSRLLHKHQADEHLHIYVSTKMREIGHLLIELQSHVSEKDLMHFLKPSYFPLRIQSVLNVTKSEKGKEAVPSLALKLGHSLKKCGQLLRSQHLMADDFEAAKQSETFISLIESDWAELVSHHALQQQKRRKDNQPALLPLTEDIKVLMKYIDTETSRLLNAMNNSLCQGIWKDLAELLLCQVILFNRRRPGEVERLQTTSCKHLLEGENYPSQSTLDTELTKSLSPFEMKLIDRMARIETRGKRGRGVAIILTPSMKQTLTTLLNTRDSVGILPTNTHVFACPPSSNLNGYRCVQKVVKMCPGLKQPENITSTKLRKHIASLSQVMNLHDNEMDLLASHMGHDIRIHREYYRLPQDILETAKVSKLLVMMEKGNMQHLKGKTSDELHVPINDGLSESDGEEDDNFSDDKLGVPEEINSDYEEDVTTKEYGKAKSLKINSNEDQVQTDPKNKNKNKARKAKEVEKECYESEGTDPKNKNKNKARKAKEVEKECYESEGTGLGHAAKRCDFTGKTRNRRIWTEEEKSAVERHLALFIANRKVPGKVQSEACLEKEPVLKARGRTWTDIKSYIHNRICALKRIK